MVLHETTMEKMHENLAMHENNGYARKLVEKTANGFV